MSDTPAGFPVRAPCRVRHGYTQSIHAPPETVFPLLCPVRECDWVPGWSPDWVISASGVAERGCVFQTPGEEGNPPAIWFITRHEPQNFHVEMLKTVPGHTVIRLEIRLQEDGAGGTRAEIAYEYTALGPAGEEFVKARTRTWYQAFMRDWEAAMNEYLTSRDEAG
jgi:hypothetical protein